VLLPLYGYRLCTNLEVQFGYAKVNFGIYAQGCVCAHTPIAHPFKAKLLLIDGGGG
jgi:hypothetical protein